VKSPALWLAVRELGARRQRVALAALVVATTAAAATAMELVARAREEAMAAQIDAMGPALTVVPPGVTAGALARQELGAGVLAPGAEAAARAALGRDLRTIERRLVLQREIAGVRVPVVGVEAGVLPAGPGTAGAAALGSELARRLGDVSSVTVEGRELRISGVMPSTGSGEDVAVLVPLRELQALAGVDGANELRLFLRAGVSPRDGETRLSRANLGAAVIRSDRGEVADREAQESLARHRGVAYAVMAVVAGLCLLIAAHLDAAERRVEVATLVAIGASRWTVLGTLLSRSALVAAAGAAIGVAGGAALAAAQDGTVVEVVASAWIVAATTVAAALAVGVVAAAPTALLAVARDPVRELQES
jgi:putative ABC transport system permease protein